MRKDWWNIGHQYSRNNGAQYMCIVSTVNPREALCGLPIHAILADPRGWAVCPRCVAVGPPSELAGEVLTAVRKERKAQDAKWGEQNHDLTTWLTILTEEVGEFAEAILENRAGKEVRAEVIQIAAVAVAIAEFLDRHMEE